MSSFSVTPCACGWPRAVFNIFLYFYTNGAKERILEYEKFGEGFNKSVHIKEAPLQLSYV